MSKRYLITTPIYYVNDKPHIGHTYCTVAADILARWRRMQGCEVLFTTGVDENASKTTEAAARLNEDVRQYADRMAKLWETTWLNAGISFDFFIRTTSDQHSRTVNAFWQKVDSAGDIYKGKYEGWYCSGCEAYVKESDLVDGLCPNHKKAPIRLEEENYFFKLQEYRDRLLAHMGSNNRFVAPQSRFNEVKNYIADYLEPLSISRVDTNWGLKVPGDESQTIYVWFDALLNYLTAAGYGWDDELCAKWWGEDTHILHIVGKDIIKFHCAIWPAMLLSADVRLPDQVFAHGFFTMDGDKISKSLGNAIDPLELAAGYGFDAVRYFLFREIPFGEDGDFSFDRLHKRYTADLANDLGNLVNRTLVMFEKYFADGLPPADDGKDFAISAQVEKSWQGMSDALDLLRFDRALDSIWALVTALNQFVDLQKPWELAKSDQEKLGRVMFNLIEGIRQTGLLLAPFLPETSDKILGQLGIEPLDLKKGLADGMLEKYKTWGHGYDRLAVNRGDNLFPRLD